MLVAQCQGLDVLRDLTHAGDMDDKHAAGNTPSANTPGQTSNEGHTGNLGDLTDVSHTFDQTNGLVDGLSGDADQPEQADSAAEDVDETVEETVPAVPVPPSGTSQNAVPVVVDPPEDEDEDPNP